MRKSLLAMAALVAVLFAPAPASAQHPCGSAYVPNRYGGTVVTGLPSCDQRYGWRHRGVHRYWGPNNSGYMNGGGYFTGGSYGSYRHVRKVRIRTMTVHGEEHSYTRGQRPDMNQDIQVEGFYVIHERE